MNETVLRIAILPILGCLLLDCRISLAGGGPENVFLLVNSSSEASLTIANHYVRLRKIPPSNVYYIPWEQVVNERGWAATTRPVFVEKILSPAMEEIARRNLADQIDYIIYSSDFPIRVYYTDILSLGKTPKAHRPDIAITAATYLSEFTTSKSKAVVATKIVNGMNENAFSFSDAR